MKLGRWHKINGRALRECTVGVIGVGDIVRELMRKLQPWGCKLLGYDIVDPPAEFLEATGAKMVPVEEVIHVKSVPLCWLVFIRCLPVNRFLSVVLVPVVVSDGTPISFWQIRTSFR
eukprot:SAG31_NODE_3506_length_4187_cov_1.703767_6_plen_117_part_00